MEPLERVIQDLQKLVEELQALDLLVQSHKISQVEFHHRLTTLEGRFLTLETDVVRTREAILSKLQEMSVQIQQIQTDKLISEDREKRNKFAGGIINTIITTGINAIMLCIALKTAGVI